jgi:hypothetical protein
MARILDLRAALAERRDRPTPDVPPVASLEE